MKYLKPQTMVLELDTRYSVMAANSEGKEQMNNPSNQEYPSPARQLYVF